MEQIGYSLVDAQGSEITTWGQALGVLHGIPDVVILPNGDRVHCASVGPIQDWHLAPRYGQKGYDPITFDGSKVVVSFPVTADDVNRERDRRLATFTFNGVEFDFVDDKGSESNIQGAYSLAFSAIIAGAQPGNLRWADPASDFGWIAHDNSIVTMDAPTVIEFGKKAAAHKSALIFRARALKNMSPIPADYASDQYWT
jgi:hypothetical protein